MILSLEGPEKFDQTGRGEAVLEEVLIAKDLQC
jgi:hypothetical protein